MIQPHADFESVVFTDPSRCRDCQRCARACPVKAIAVKGGRTRVIDERCLACGTCVRVCPRRAKRYRDDTTRVQALLRGTAPVAASVAPTFAAVLDEKRRRRLPAALRRLGFAWVGETTVGSALVAGAVDEAVRRAPQRAHVCSSCPAVVRYVERYRADAVDLLTPVISPLMAHARALHARLGKSAKVVFFGPCIAKKAEIQRPEHRGLVDAVVTFEGLRAWLERAGMRLEDLPEEDFDERPLAPLAPFALEGDPALDAAWDDAVAVTGPAELGEALDSLVWESSATLVDALFCPGGCLNGPAAGTGDSLFDRRRRLRAYRREPPVSPAAAAPAGELKAVFRADAALLEPAFSDDRLAAVLLSTGKARREDELDCGACGYPTCRERAAAVLQGMTELEMCVPHVRRLATQRSDRIVDHSPNAIVVCDEQLVVLRMNPAFRRLFGVTDAQLGRPVDEILDPGAFTSVLEADGRRLDRQRQDPRRGILLREIVFPLPYDRQLVGIFTPALP